MPYISADALPQVRQIDLLSYLRANEPGNPVRLSGNNYRTGENKSRISALIYFNNLSLN